MLAKEGKQNHYKEKKGDLTVIAASGDPFGCTAK